MKKLRHPVHADVRTLREGVAIGVMLLIVLVTSSTSWLASASAAPLRNWADASSISIHQEMDFKASPQRVYEALLDSKQFSAFSGAPAEIHAEAGGAFSLFNGHIIGRNIELLPNRRIVQAWRVVTWDEGIYSIVKFELKPMGSGTRLIMDHTGFPEGKKEHLDEGWKTNYWAPLRKYLG